MFEGFIGRTFVNHAALVYHVLQAITHPGVGGFTVAPGAPGFLVVAFDVFGHVQVRHKAHIGLVNAHAKGYGGHHHNAFAAQKLVLVGLPDPAVQARVVGQGGNAFVAQRVGDFLHPFARLAVHNARISPVLVGNKAQQLLGSVLFFNNGVADVGPVKAA